MAATIAATARKRAKPTPGWYLNERIAVATTRAKSSNTIPIATPSVITNREKIARETSFTPAGAACDVLGTMTWRMNALRPGSKAFELAMAPVANSSVAVEVTTELDGDCLGSRVR